MSAKQALYQKVLHRYGWSARLDKEQQQAASLNDVKHNDDQQEESPPKLSFVWSCHVRLGIRDERQFAATQTFNDTEKGQKQGKNAACQAALDGLQDEIQRQEAKPLVELTDAFPLYPHDQQDGKPRFLIKGATPRNWNKYIWEPYERLQKERQEQRTSHSTATRPILTVGIDVEGNQSSPPVLVQIATADCVLLEIPSMNGSRPQLSHNLQRLLRDDSILKVFCDNYSHHDKTSLGISTDSANFSQAPIVDLEVLATQVLGPVSAPRGLSRIVTLLLPPELQHWRIGKPPGRTNNKKRFKTIGRFALIEQGKAPPLSSLRDLTEGEQLYAAMDAWATLWAMERLEKTCALIKDTDNLPEISRENYADTTQSGPISLSLNVPDRKKLGQNIERLGEQATDQGNRPAQELLEKAKRHNQAALDHHTILQEQSQQMNELLQLLLQRATQPHMPREEIESVRISVGERLAAIQGRLNGLKLDNE